VSAVRLQPFTAFAVLHGGTFPGGFGKRRVRGWFSTGRQDSVRSPDTVRGAYEEARGPGSPFEIHVFEGGHGIGDEERRAVVAWWLRG
jgi:predicted esterase